jgi:hypothetical protein
VIARSPIDTLHVQVGRSTAKVSATLVHDVCWLDARSA